MAINDLSGRRMILGLGSGWYAEEHTIFGYRLGDVKTHLDLLEVGLHIITELVHNPGSAAP